MADYKRSDFIKIRVIYSDDPVCKGCYFDAWKCKTEGVEGFDCKDDDGEDYIYIESLKAKLNKL